MRPDIEPQYFKLTRELYDLAESLPHPQSAKVLRAWARLFFDATEPERGSLPRAAAMLYQARREDVLRIRRCVRNGAKNRRKTDGKPTKTHVGTSMKSDAESIAGFRRHASASPADSLKVGTYPEANPNGNQTPNRTPLGNNKELIANTKEEKPTTCVVGKEKAGEFAPPTLEEVSAYVAKVGATFTAEEFVDYYSAQGWMVSRDHRLMDWRAKVMEWQGRRDKRQQGAAEEGHIDLDGYQLEEDEEW